MLNLDFATTMLINNGKVISFTKFHETIWAYSVVRGILKDFAPILMRNNVEGSVTISTKDEKIFVFCNTNSPIAESEMIQQVERKQTLSGTNKLYWNKRN